MVVSNHQEVVQTTNPWKNVLNDRRSRGSFRLHHSKSNRKGDRHKLDRKTRYWRDFLKSENYHLISLENLLQKNLLNGGREIYLALAINNRSCFFFKENKLG